MILIIGLAVLMISGSGCSKMGRDIGDEFEGREDVRVYEVFGMDCPGCHSAVEKLVKKVPGVQDAEANWSKQRLVVFVQPGNQLSDDEIFDAVKRANFTAGERVK